MLSGSATQTLKLKTVSAEELAPARKLSAASGRLEGLEKRASIGAAIGSTGSVRDTLGIFFMAWSATDPPSRLGSLENMSMIIRNRSAADTNRLVYRKATPSVNRMVTRKVTGA